MRWLCGTSAGLLLGLGAGSASAQEWSPEHEEQRSAHHARSFIEMGAGLALGATGYWILMDRNVADWDNPRPGARFDGSAWVLDNNSLGVNYLGHPLTGGLSYSFARANHYGVPASFGYSFLTSFLWEFVLEFKEKVSINDVVVTPGAGLPIGEFFYKLGSYLDTGERSTALDIARWTLGTGVALDRSLDGRPAPRVKHRDSLGFSRSIWHRFDVAYGVSAIDTPRLDQYARYSASISGRLVTLPGYLAPRRFGRAFYGADIADLSLQVEGSRYGWGQLAFADTVLAGYHAQDLRRAGHALEGPAFTVGTSVGWAYVRSAANRYQAVESAIAQPKPENIKYHVPNRREQWAAFNLPGVAADFRYAAGPFRVSLQGRLAPSFGSVGAAAFYDWAAANLTEKSKHILHRQGYFYGWGVATSCNAELGLGPLRAGFDLRYATYASQDGLDRHIEQLTVDVPAQGDVLFYRGSLGVAPEPGHVSLSLQLAVRRFRSQVGGFERTARSVERGLGAQWVF